MSGEGAFSMRFGFFRRAGVLLAGAGVWLHLPPEDCRIPPCGGSVAPVDTLSAAG